MFDLVQHNQKSKHIARRLIRRHQVAKRCFFGAFVVSLYGFVGYLFYALPFNSEQYIYVALLLGACLCLTHLMHGFTYELLDWRPDTRPQWLYGELWEEWLDHKCKLPTRIFLRELNSPDCPIRIATLGGALDGDDVQNR